MKPITKSKDQLKKAASKIERMEKAASIDEYEGHWIDFLHELERSWNKLVSQLKASPKYQGWTRRGQVERLRKQDSLLSYLVNARGAEEHSVADISKRSPGGIGISPAEGNSLTLRNLRIEGGNISFEHDQPVRVDFIPGKMELLEVENRGRKYRVPSSHLGSPIESNDPVVIARLAIEFYESYFNEAEKFFVK